MGSLLDILFETTAMALDTLPLSGRVLLFAAGLSLSFAGLAWLIRKSPATSMQVLYRKAALVSLLVMPLLLAVFDVRTPVHVPEVRAYTTAIPAWVVYGALTVWLLGCTYPALRLRRRLRSVRALLAPMAPVDRQTGRKVLARLDHWQRRLSLSGPICLRLGGGQQAWHAHRDVVLPSACLNWSPGLVDCALLLQLSQIKQARWQWLMLGEVVQIVYWPAPWVARLVTELKQFTGDAPVHLARAAYRDPSGWQRDCRGLIQRYDTLQPPPQTFPVLGVDVGRTMELATGGSTNSERAAADSAQDFDAAWQRTKLRRALKHFDPYERAYWLIAVATLVVGTVTTMTVAREPPEFEPEFLDVRWQDRMGRRLSDDDAGPPERRETTDTPPPR